MRVGDSRRIGKQLKGMRHVYANFGLVLLEQLRSFMRARKGLAVRVIAGTGGGRRRIAWNLILADDAAPDGFAPPIHGMASGSIAARGTLQAVVDTSSMYSTASMTPTALRSATLLLPARSIAAKSTVESSGIGIGQNVPLASHIR
jgi:hypothetical protein